MPSSDQDGHPAVFVAKDGVAQLRPVTLGLNGTSHAQVLNGLTEGELVVTLRAQGVEGWCARCVQRTVKRTDRTHMKLTEIAIRRPAFITMIFVTLAVLGIFGYSRMGVDLLPKMDWPYVSIVTIYPGAGPKEVESLVSKPLEEAVSGLNKLDNVRSYSYEGVSVVLAQFNFSADVDAVTNDVQRAVEQAGPNCRTT